MRWLNHPSIDRIRVLVNRRFVDHPSWVILVELFIGLGWIRAATEKIINRDWWTGDVIESFVADNRSLTIDWYEPLIEHLILPNVTVIVVLVVLGQIAAGASLLTGQRLNLGLFIGMTMNINFMMIGAVDPSIFYLILQASLAFWLFETRKKTDMSMSYLRWITRLAVVLIVVSAPFVRTLDPAFVVEDPAMVLATYGVSVAVSGYVALHRLNNDDQSASTPV